VDFSEITFDHPAVRLLMDMYQGMGNRLALQYGGSHLAHTMSTYRDKTYASLSRDLITTLKRFYTNVFTDKEKQDSINLFLGHYIPYNESVPLWELETDYHLHVNHEEIQAERLLLCNSKWWQPALSTFLNNLMGGKREITEQVPEKNRLEEYQKELDEIYAGQLTSFDLALARDFNQPLQLVLLGDDETSTTSLEPASPIVPRHSSASSFTTPGKTDPTLLDRSSTRGTPSSRLRSQRRRLFGSRHFSTRNEAAGDGDGDGDDDEGNKSEDEEANALLKNYGVKKWFSWQYHHKPKRTAITAPHLHGRRAASGGDRTETSLSILWVLGNSRRIGCVCSSVRDLLAIGSSLRRALL